MTTIKWPQVPKQFQSGNSIPVERAVLLSVELNAYGLACAKAALEAAESKLTDETFHVAAYHIRKLIEEYK